MSLTGVINLKACKHYKNKFEQGMVNEFTVEAVDLGDLEKLRIGHDNSGGFRKGSPDQEDAVTEEVNTSSLPIREFIWLVLELCRDRRRLSGSETTLPVWPLVG